jgi:DHA1 family tetracycline resistance protein-like MFS transporter
VLYTDYRYGWGPVTVGNTLSLVGLCTAFVQGFLVRKWMPRTSERRMILVGLAFCMFGYLLFGLAPSAWIFLAGIPLLCLGGLASPPAQSLITQQVDPGEQGRLQGALTSLQSLAGIFGPALFANLFALFISNHAPVRHLPGISFVLAAALILASLALTAWITRHKERATAGEPV